MTKVSGTGDASIAYLSRVYDDAYLGTSSSGTEIICAQDGAEGDVVWAIIRFGVSAVESEDMYVDFAGCIMIGSIRKAPYKFNVAIPSECYGFAVTGVGSAPTPGAIYCDHPLAGTPPACSNVSCVIISVNGLLSPEPDEGPGQPLWPSFLYAVCSGTPAASGTLYKVSGSGPATIPYSGVVHKFMDCGGLVPVWNYVQVTSTEDCAGDYCPSGFYNGKQKHASPTTPYWIWWNSAAPAHWTISLTPGTESGKWWKAASTANIPAPLHFTAQASASAAADSVLESSNVSEVTFKGGYHLEYGSANNYDFCVWTTAGPCGARHLSTL